jgi:ribonuclease P protein component
MTHPAPSPDRRLLFRRRQRLTLDRDYRRAYAAGCSAACGPLRVHLVVNNLEPPVTRLGLSVGRRVGTATVRTRIKRLLREAFRLSQACLPSGVDLVVSVHPHKPLTLAEYTGSLLKAVVAAQARQRQQGPRRVTRDRAQPLDRPNTPPPPGAGDTQP